MVGICNCTMPNPDSDNEICRSCGKFIYADDDHYDTVIRSLADELNKKDIHPKEDWELLLESLQDIGLFFTSDDNESEWYYDPD